MALKIVMIHPHDVLCPGEPWTRRIVSIARGLSRRGHEVQLVYFPFQSAQELQPFTRDTIRYVPFSRTMTPSGIAKNALRLQKLVHDAQVVHLQKCHHYAAIPALIACYRTGTPLHYDWDDWEEKIWLEACGRNPHSLFIAATFSILERALPYLADSVTCSSAYLRSLALRRKAPPSLIGESPVGVDMRLFCATPADAVRKEYRLAADERVILYVGQLNGSQYVDMFIKAANIVLHRTRTPHRIKCMVVGDGYMRTRLMDMADELGMADNFIFTGAVPADEVGAYIHAADICVAPFKKTKVTLCKSPLKIVEYMACGKCIVASAVGEVVEMLGGCAYLAQEGSYKDLAAGIGYFLERLDDEPFLKTLKERLAQRLTHKYTWEYTVDNLLSLYGKIAGLT